MVAPAIAAPAAEGLDVDITAGEAARGIEAGCVDLFLDPAAGVAENRKGY